MRNCNKRLRPVEADLHSLLSQFTAAVSNGAEPSFATFKAIWAKRHFSWIFLGNNTELSTDKYVQSLYAITLDCLDIPISADTATPAGSDAVQQQHAPEHTRASDDPASDLNLHRMMFEEDADDDEPNPNSFADMSFGNKIGVADGVGAASHTAANPNTPNSTHAANGTISADHNMLASCRQLTQADLMPDFASAHPMANGSLEGTSMLYALPDVPLQSHPTSGPQGQHPPPSGDIVMTAADPQLDSPTRVLEDQQEPAAETAAAGPNHASNLLPAQPNPQIRLPAPNLVLTEADFLMDSTPDVSHSVMLNQQPPLSESADTTGQAASESVGQEPSESAGNAAPESVDHVPSQSAGNVTSESAPIRLTYQSSGASLAARAAQRQRSGLAPMAMRSAAPAPSSTPAPAHEPLRNMFTKDTSHRPKPNPAKVPLETKIGTLYAIYCLHETQPGRVPVYLPLELLQQLLDVVKDAHATPQCDAVQVVTQLMYKKAFVIGAVRRPPRGSTADEASLQPANRMAASTLSGADAKAETEREAVYHIKSMYRGLALVGPLQGLCREYKEAKAHSWKMSGVKGKPMGFANLTVGVKLAQLLHQATTKITPKIRRKKAGRGPRRKRANPDSAPGITPSRTPGRTSGPGRPPTVEPEADLDKDEELDSLLEHTFNELASDTEASASAAHGRAAASPANSADEDSNNDDNNGDSGAASGDEHMPGMGGFLDIDFAGIASNAEEEFAEALMPVKLPPGAQRALDRDNARKRQRHVAQRGWDAFQTQLEQQTARIAAQDPADMDFDMLPGGRLDTDQDSDSDVATLAGMAGLETLACSPPARQQPSHHSAAASASQGRRVHFQPDSETFQAGATLTGIAHGPRAVPSGPAAAAPNARQAKEQPDQPKKKPGRPKGSKNKPKAAAAAQEAASLEASGTVSAANSAPKSQKAPSLSAKKKKPASSQTPSTPLDPPKLDYDASPLHASSSQQQAGPTPAVSAPQPTGHQAGHQAAGAAADSLADLASALSQRPASGDQPSLQADQRQQQQQQQPQQQSQALLPAGAASVKGPAPDDIESKLAAMAGLDTLYDDDSD